MDIYTIGHSTHSIACFIHMLKIAHIEVLADVRALPGSNKFPHFNQENLREHLKAHAIDYVYFPHLTGRRNKSQLFQNELNAGWNNQSFHNYADYTLTDSFTKGRNRLQEIAKEKPTAICCSERHPARCHRLLISNALTANNWQVFHIVNNKEKVQITPHVLGQWGAMPIIERDGTVVYPRLKNKK